MKSRHRLSRLLANPGVRAVRRSFADDTAPVNPRGYGLPGFDAPSVPLPQGRHPYAASKPGDTTPLDLPEGERVRLAHQETTPMPRQTGQRPRPYVPRVPRPMPRTAPHPPAAFSRPWIDRLTYPPIGASPEKYAAFARRLGPLTGTTSTFEHPGAWPEHTPALPVAGTSDAEYQAWQQYREQAETGTAETGEAA